MLCMLVNVYDIVKKLLIIEFKNRNNYFFKFNFINVIGF